MKKARSIVLLTLGLLWSSAGFSDDTRDSVKGKRDTPVDSLSVERMLANSAYLPEWQPFMSAETVPGTRDWQRSVAGLDFEDVGVFSRFRNLRGLSLLTLAEVGRTRLFLGVNNDGLVGLHFNVFPNKINDRYLEFSRMPYLSRSKGFNAR